MRKFAFIVFAVGIVALITSMLLVSFQNNPELNDPKVAAKAQFSSWDGSHMGLTRLVKANMKDPDSYEHIDTQYRVMDSVILIVMRFRGKNSFGGLVPSIVTAKADLNGNVIEYNYE